MFAVGNRIDKLAPLSWAILIAILVNTTITVEWSFPYCNDPQDGPAHAAFGFPLPYTQWGGVSSLEYLFAPAAYAFNMVVLVVVLFVGLRRITSAIGKSSPKFGRFSSSVALILATIAIVFELFKMGTIYTISVLSLGNAYHPLTDFRPVGVSSAVHYDCKPSEFWFGRVVRR